MNDVSGERGYKGFAEKKIKALCDVWGQVTHCSKKGFEVNVEVKRERGKF